MKSLIIKRVKFVVKNYDNIEYGANVTFESGLNIIYGPNSVGKSSLITGIIYCLGSEKGLGVFQNKQNPFKPEFYDKIEGKKIKNSYILLEISNGEKVITLARRIIGKTDIVAMKEVTIENIDKKAKTKDLIANGEGVFSENGLQKFLFDFLGWEPVSIPTYENKFSKLYFENLLPLFFVEQRSGWSQIQSRQVTRYGIREVKKVAFEYLLGLDRFKIHLKEIEKKELNEKVLDAKKEIIEIEENLMVLTQGKFEDNVLLVYEHTYGRGSIYDVLSMMNKNYDTSIQSLENFDNVSESNENVEDSLREKMRTLSHRVRKETEKVKFLEQEIASYENYINRIEINKQKNYQLKRIEKLTFDFNISSCPVCENQLLENNTSVCKLCHNDLKRKISTPDENLDFLEDEKTSFVTILVKKRVELKKAKYKLQELKEQEKSASENLDHSIKTYINPQFEKYRDLVLEIDKLKILITRYNRVVERLKNLDYKREQLELLEKESKDLQKEIKSYKESSADATTMKTLVDNFKSNAKSLRMFNSKPHLVDSIKINDNDNYTPYLEEYDLYNISSSSDNVRIIISYYLSLLQTSIELKDSKIRFPNILILDEPKQQNLDNDDINTFIKKLKGLKSCQVILTTYSERTRDKSHFKQFIRHEMVDKNDYLLKRVTK